MKIGEIKSVLTLHNGFELTVCEQMFDWSLKDESIPHVHGPQCVKKIEFIEEDILAYNFNDELIGSIHHCPVLVRYFTEGE
jgi:hypothetical protein